jgi:hypothetical protein
LLYHFVDEFSKVLSNVIVGAGYWDVFKIQDGPAKLLIETAGAFWFK